MLTTRNETRFPALENKINGERNMKVIFKYILLSLENHLGITLQTLN